MRSIANHNGKKICNECHSRLPQEERGGRGMMPVGWVPDESNTTKCNFCGEDGYETQDRR